MTAADPSTQSAHDEGAAGARTARRVLIAALVLLLVSALPVLSDRAALAMDVLAYPHEYGYGEGVVAQQALMILRGEGYSDLTQEPYVVFHYPPVFHLAAGAVAAATGNDIVAGGRLASILASIAAAGILGWLVWAHARQTLAPLTGPRVGPGAGPEAGPGAGLGAGLGARPGAVIGAAEPEARALPPLMALAAAALALAQVPLANSIAVNRVDTVALAAGMAALALATGMLRRPWLMLPTALAIAATLYAKQSYLALPAAAMGGAILLAPRLGWRLTGLTLALG
ncbi:MAG: hypothetical protein AAF677_14845, partial [Pseudomonadota bacterium]